MLSYSIFPLNMWGKVLKIAVHILNKVCTKAVQKTIYELWTSRRLLLTYIHNGVV